jgi:hypothetical protein
MFGRIIRLEAHCVADESIISGAVALSKKNRRLICLFFDWREDDKTRIVNDGLGVPSFLCVFLRWLNQPVFSAQQFAHHQLA